MIEALVGDHTKYVNHSRCVIRQLAIICSQGSQEMQVKEMGL